MDLTNLLADEYVDQASSAAGSPISEEVEQVPPEAIWEEGSSSQLAMVALLASSPSPVLEISLANPIVADPLLASVDQAKMVSCLSLRRWQKLIQQRWGSQRRCRVESRSVYLVLRCSRSNFLCFDAHVLGWYVQTFGY